MGGGMFECPGCKGKDTLQIIAALELAPGPASDERTVQLASCRQCSFFALALYEESHRGSLESESVSHNGYPIAEGKFKALMELMKACPDPFARHCGCQAHVSLAGNLPGSSGVPSSSEILFPMKLLPGRPAPDRRGEK